MSSETIHQIILVPVKGVNTEEKERDFRETNTSNRSTKKIDNGSKNEDEIKEKIRHKLWSDRKFIIKTIVIALTAGLFTGVVQPPKYQSDTTILPEYVRSIGYAGNILDSRIGSIISTINTSTYRGRTDAVRIDLYPALITSNLVLSNVIKMQMDTPFQEGNSRFNTNKSVVDYLNDDLRSTPMDYFKRYVLQFPYILNKIVQSDTFFVSDTIPLNLSNTPGLFFLSDREEKALKYLRNSTSATFRAETGTIHISVRMSDAVAAAIINQLILQETHRIITEYQKEKFQLDYVYLNSELEIAKKNMDEKRLELAHYIDQNTDTYSATQQSVLFQKEFDFKLANSIYRSYLFQTEESRMKSNEDTPLFTYLSPTTVPVESLTSEIKNTIVLFLFTGLIIIFIHHYYKYRN